MCARFFRRALLLCVAFASACGGPSTLSSYSSYTAAAPTSAPLPQSSEVTLDQVLSYADKHAPQIAVARAGIARAVAAQHAAAPILPSDPVLRFGIGSRRSGSGSELDAEVGLEQEFEVAGQRGLRLRAADATGDLESRRIERVRWRVHLNVHTAFHQALLARERLAFAGELVAFSQRLRDVANKRADAGDISPLQVDVAAGELALAEQELADATARDSSARLRLAELSGWPEETPPRPVGELDEPQQVDDVDALVDIALNHHPELRVHQAAVERASARARVADREIWPNITVGVSLAREKDPADIEEQRVGLITLSVPLPLFRRNAAAKAEARAEAIGAFATAEATRRIVRVRVIRAAQVLNSQAERVEAYRQTIVPAFSANMTKLVRAFELGEVDVLEVLVARGRFLELQRKALTTYGDYFEAIATLEAELGRDVWPDEHKKGGPR